ncbi:MAG: molecular chaperone Skp [Ignavibacteriae bacterium HGW-Ignavibacteriae-2]|nr:OmpH family outer membrane protein [Bacteroidota bacterium]PKL89146.1 MAG: molecular chaperone Skp [Ignavibacteriae bacterium HGW-Ignavibacteriae-2]
MKKLLLISIFLIASASMFAQGQQKIGYVDSQIILAQYAPAIKAQSDLDAIAAKFTKTRDSMVTVLQTAYADYEKQKEMMTPDKQREMQQSLVAKQQTIQKFEQEKFSQQGGQLYAKNEELFAPVKAKIMDTINEVAKEEGMHFIFDKTGEVLLLYADADFDLTYKVLDRLKRTKK